MQRRRAYFWAENFRAHPRVVSEILGLTPKDVWVAGETPLRGGRIAIVNSWSVESQVAPTAPLDEHIASLLGLVGPRLETLRRTLVSLDTGISCVDYFTEFQGNGFHLTVELIKSLADMHLSVDFDLYGAALLDA